MFRIFKKKKNSYEEKNVEFFEKTDGGVRISVKRSEYRQFYDSVWIVDITHLADNGRDVVCRFCCTLVRQDTEDAVSLEKQIRSIGDNLTLESIQMLDERKNILYD